MISHPLLIDSDDVAESRLVTSVAQCVERTARVADEARTTLLAKLSEVFEAPAQSASQPVHLPPFTNDSPLNWNVPPGVSEVQCVELGTCWQIRGSTQFTSVVSSASVVRGKWQYEVVLISDGLFQIGWCAPLMLFPWTPRLGVGDFPFTVGLDGHRQQLWNVSATPCGPKWVSGDVISCGFDLEEGEVSFFINGELICKKPMLTMMSAQQRSRNLNEHLKLVNGSQPSSIVGGESSPSSSRCSLSAAEIALTFSPALSLGAFETCCVNLGAYPFRFPIPGHSAVDTHGLQMQERWTSRAVLLSCERLIPFQHTVLASLIRQIGLDTLSLPPTASSMSPWVSFACCIYRASLRLALGRNGDGSLVVSLMKRALVMLRDEDRITLVGILASQLSLDAGTRRIGTSNTSEWTPSTELHVLRLWTENIPMFRDLWSTSEMFVHDILQIFHVKPYNTFDQRHILFPLDGFHQRDELLATGDGQKTVVLPTTVGEEDGGAFHVDVADDEIREWGRAALDDYDDRSVAFYDCVVAVDDSRRAAILRALLQGDSTAVVTLQTVEMIISDLRRQLAQRVASQQQSQQSSRPARVSHLHNDGQTAVRMYFSLVTIISENADLVRQHEMSTAQSENDIKRTLQHVFCPASLLLQPIIEGADLARLGGTHSSICNQFQFPVGDSASAIFHEPSANARKYPVVWQSLLIKTMILFSSSVKDTLVANCGDVLLRHRQKDAWVRAHPEHHMDAFNPFYRAMRRSDRSASHRVTKVQQSPPSSASSRVKRFLSTTVVEGDFVLVDAFEPEVEDCMPADGREMMVVSAAGIVPTEPVPSRLTAEARRRLLLDLLQTGRQCAWGMATLFYVRSWESLSALCALIADIMDSCTSEARVVPHAAQQNANPSATHLGPSPGTGRPLGGAHAPHHQHQAVVSSSTAGSVGGYQQVHQHQHSNRSALFLLIPVVFVECFVDTWHFIRKTSPHYPKLVEQYPQNILFFLRHLLNGSISNPQTAEYLLLSLSGIVDTIELHRSAVVGVLKQHRALLVAVMHHLLRQLEHPLGWTLAVTSWTKMHQGNSFCLVDIEEESAEWNAAFVTRRAFVNYGGGGAATAAAALVSSASSRTSSERRRQHQGVVDEDAWRRPPAAFLFYREVFGGPFLSEGPQTARTFFKCLLERCNWSVSELGACLSQLHEVVKSSSSGRGGGNGGASAADLKRRASLCFELTRKVLHILEFAVDAGKHAFFRVGGAACSTQEEQHRNVKLVVELWTQTLTRFCTRLSRNVLTDVMGLRLAGLEKLSQWKIVAPLMGVLHAMLDGASNLSPATNPFLAELEAKPYSWPLEALEWMFEGIDWTTLNGHCPWEKASPFVSPDLGVLSALRVIHNRSSHRHRMPDEAEDDDGLCTICYLKRADTVFAPCQHVSCVECINRQMRESGRCFYCNGTVTGLRPKM